MVPYYEENGIVIYNANCFDLLPRLAPDLVLSDPPYGTGWVRGGGDVGEFNAKHTKESWDVWSTDWIQLCNSPVAFFGPYARREEIEAISTSLLWWRKTNPRPNGPDREPIGVIGVECSGEFACYNGDTPFHPCQKPTALMRWIIKRIGIYGLIVDPFMGSGTTLRAAKDLGLKAIGIEISEQYCEIAAKRLAQNAFNFETVAT
jgi:site-specific DNA-methyltransferase (adenine-specific)